MPVQFSLRLNNEKTDNAMPQQTESMNIEVSTLNLSPIKSFFSEKYQNKPGEPAYKSSSPY